MSETNDLTYYRNLTHYRYGDDNEILAEPEQKVNETKIPDDLQKGYEWLVNKGNVSMVPMSIAWVLKLIERISAAEAREKELREEIAGFPNLAAMRQAMVDTADENASLRVEVDSKDSVIAFLRSEYTILKSKLAEATKPVTQEDVFAFSLDTLDPKESIPLLLAARAAKGGGVMLGEQESLRVRAEKADEDYDRLVDNLKDALGEGLLQTVCDPIIGFVEEDLVRGIQALRAQLAELQLTAAQQQEIVLNKSVALLALEAQIAEATKPVSDEKAETSFHIWNNITDGTRWEELEPGEQERWKLAMIEARRTSY